ncbi:secreted RxLR effector protein 161-like [Elaeis guineensis]|uniref:secreted RxLR effector protein 161-like n=1 Tax=Elaeis guineensis var. tenera TaxID=51953 RepID=UPI003C6D829C
MDLLKRFGMLNCKSAKTPINANGKLSLDDGIEKANNEKHFRSIVGGLMFVHNPSKHHLSTAKRILRYVQGTLSFGISVDDRKSTTGYVFCLASGAILWVSKKQQTTALSSTKAKYVAATAASSHAI